MKHPHVPTVSHKPRTSSHFDSPALPAPVFPQINDRLEFPIELNMYPYTKEGRAATTTAASKEGGHEEVGTEGADAEVEVSGMNGGVGREGVCVIWRLAWSLQQVSKRSTAMQYRVLLGSLWLSLLVLCISVTACVVVVVVLVSAAVGPGSAPPRPTC